MASDSENQPARSSAQDNFFDGLVGITVDAAVKTFVVMILGNIALSLVGSITGSMIPSAPPGFTEIETPSSNWSAWWAAVRGIKFYLIFAILFFFGFRMRYIKPSSNNLANVRASRWERTRQRFADNWFGSLVGNAFLAMALAPVLAVIPQFTLWHWFWNWLSSVLKPEQIIGEDWMSHLRPWLGWYGHNQLKFNFWLIYLGAVCDDLGIPNFKSLVRWLWRRQRRAKVSTPHVIAAEDSSESH